jgi:hypothetical protein
MRLGLILSLFFASPAFCVAGAEGVGPVAPGLYSVTTEIETEMQDTGTGTLLDTWTEPFSGAACLEGEVSQRVRPETFADTRCSFSNIRPDPYGEAFDLYCVFPEGLLSGSGTLAVDPTRPTEFREAFTLRGAGAVASQRVTIKGRRVGACQLAGQ